MDLKVVIVVVVVVCRRTRGGRGYQQKKKKKSERILNHITLHCLLFLVISFFSFSAFFLKYPFNLLLSLRSDRYIAIPIVLSYKEGNRNHRKTEEY